MSEKPKFFATPALFRAWLAKHHDRADVDLLHAAAFGHALLHLEHEHAQRQMDLRPRQPDALVRVHRLHHVVDEALELAGLDVFDLDVRRLLAQNGMAEARHFEN